MKVTPTPLQDCYLIEIDKKGDDRGFFMESFNQDALYKELGIRFEIKQVNFAGSSKNVLRGLHYQDAPFGQAKLVGVARGAVMDVVVDIRKNSPTYLKHFKTVLDRPNLLVMVPPGFAHGYYSLMDDTMFYYFVDAFYSPDHEKGILYNDNNLGINWEIDGGPIVSPKDLNQPKLNEVVNHF
jgi:dTDP-4-dehydrorhamnose 3,5-epimerase